MDSIFYLKLFLSFLIGGSWVIFATYLADKLGAKVGGLVAGLPSTLLFGLLFIGWTQSPQAAVQATTIVPLIAGINSLFLAVYATTIGWGITTAFGVSMAMWAILAYIILPLSINFSTALIAYLCLLSISRLIIDRILKIKTVQGKKVVYTAMLIAMRGIISGLIVAFAVYIAKVGGPTLGGMLAMFPAMFVSTLFIAYFGHGAEFSASLAKSALLSAVSIVVYAVIVRFTYIPLGIVIGTLAASLFSAVSGYTIYRYVISRQD